MTRRAKVAWCGSVALHGVALLLLAFVRIPPPDDPPGKGIDTSAPDADDSAKVFVFFDPPTPLPRPPQPDPPRPPQAPTPPSRPPAPAAPPTLPQEINPGPAAPPAPAGNPAGQAGKPLHPPVGPGRSIVYVLDRSASMGPNGKLARACACLRASFRQLPPTARFQVVAYHRTAEVLLSGTTGDWAPADAGHIRLAGARLEGLRAEGSSRHDAGLRQALALEPPPDAIFWITDGDDLSAEQARLITVLNRGRSAIYPVTFAAVRPGSALAGLAAANRGRELRIEN